MRIKLIANPVSGGDARPRINAAQVFLQDAGADVDLSLTSARGDARKAAELALDEGYDRIVAAGGDGTLNEVVNGVNSPDLPIAFLPLGTVNVFALEANIPMDLEAACALVVEGEPQPITLGKIDGELFLLMASAGWDAEAVAKVRPGLKRRVGRLAYAVSALEALMKPPGELTVVSSEGTRHQGFGVVVSNCRFYGGRFVVTPEASMFHEQLHLCLLKQGGRLAMMKFATALIMGWPLKSPLVEFFALSKVELCGEKIAVQVDGDAWGELPVTIEAVPRAVTMVLPARQ